MALQIPPLAFVALRYGAVAAAGFVAARMAPRGRFAPAVEAEMDAAPRGLRVLKDDGQLSASARIVKIWRLGRVGPGWRMDGSALARLRIRRLT